MCMVYYPLATPGMLQVENYYMHQFNVYNLSLLTFTFSYSAHVYVSVDHMHHNTGIS